MERRHNEDIRKEMDVLCITDELKYQTVQTCCAKRGRQCDNGGVEAADRWNTRQGTP